MNDRVEQDAESDYWAIIELLGHVRIAGRVSEVERYGSKMGRIDIPTKDGEFVTQYFGGNSIYRETPVSESAARIAALENEPRPVHTWQLPAHMEDGTDEGGDDCPF